MTASPPTTATSDRAGPRRTSTSLLVVVLACLSACGGDRPAVMPAEVGVTVQVRLGHWSWLPDHRSAQDRSGGSGVGKGEGEGVAVVAPSSPGVRPVPAATHPVMVQIGFADEVYDALPLDDVDAPTPARAAVGVSNWIRVVDGTRTIEVGRILGREGSRIVIDLGPGISAFAY